MPEAAGCGEGETADNGKLTWLWNGSHRWPASQDFDPLPGGLGVIGLITGRKKRTRPPPQTNRST